MNSDHIGGEQTSLGNVLSPPVIAGIDLAVAPPYERVVVRPPVTLTLLDQSLLHERVEIRVQAAVMSSAVSYPRLWSRCAIVSPIPSREIARSPAACAPATSEESEHPAPIEPKQLRGPGQH